MPRGRYRTPVLKEEFSFGGERQVAGGRALREYLDSAAMEITALADDAPVTARLVHYAQSSFAVVSAPATTVVWHRTERSRARTLLVLARTGALQAVTTGVTVCRGRTALLVAPGDQPVEISATGARNELIYISAPATVLPPDVAGITRTLEGPALAFARIVPYYAFLHAMCTSPALPADEVGDLAQCSEAIVRSCARTLLDRMSNADSVVESVLAHIEQHHTNADLGTAQIAEHVGMSPRSLQAAFAAEGLTVRSALRDARVRTVQAMRETHPQLAQAHRAQLAGFSSVSAMYRALRAAPGATVDE